MSGIVEYLLIIGATWALRSFADIAVAKSKKTENTVDDILANNFKKLVNAFSFKKK